MRALVRRPSPRLAEGLVSHIERQPVDYATALQQWEGYVAALNANGWETIEVPPAPDCPDSVFIEDTVLMFGTIAVISRPGAPSRQPETAAVETTLTELGFDLRHIEAPGTFDGGDALKVGATVYVGLSARTNAAGITQLRAHLAPAGATVVAVPLSKVLHLKSAVTALPDGTIIGWPPAVDDEQLFPSFLAAPEESGAHVVLLGGNTVLISSGCPGTVALLHERGYSTVEVDIDEFIKLEGCVTCLSVRLRESAPS